MASKYIQKFPIPGSFPDILHYFVREVLRDQPENIYEYGAAYFTALDEVSQHSPETISHFISSHISSEQIAALMIACNRHTFVTLSLHRVIFFLRKKSFNASY